MTDEDLRNLLQERVEDVTTTDLSGGAWRAGRRIRTRRRLGAVAGVAAGVLVIAGIAVAAGGQPATDSDPGPTTSSPSVDEADAVVNGAPVFWSPDPAEEDELDPAEQGGLLPETIDLADSVLPVEEAPIASASAAFGVFDGSRLARLLLVSPEGDRTLDVSGLDQVAKPNGYRLPPVSDSMLSPSGGTLLFPQDGHLMLYTLASGQWSRIDTATNTAGAYWVNDELVTLPVGPVTVDLEGAPQDPAIVDGISAPPQVAQATAHGPAVLDPALQRTAQAFGYGSSVPPRDPSDYAQPETVVVAPTLGPATILAITSPADGAGRYKDCCPVAGWLDDDTVVYESRSGEPKLIGWEVGTHDFSLVSRIVGLDDDGGYVASFSDLRGDTGPAPSDAEPDVTATTDADATVRGLPVWWGPDVKTEAGLPWRDSDSLPREIDLDPGAPPATDLDAARGVVAVFAGGSLERVVVLAPDGSSRLLDASRLEPVRDEDGNAAALLPTDGGLSPDGRYVFFAQNSSIEVYEFAAATWLTIDTGDWLAEGARWSGPGSIWIPDELGSESGTAYRPDGGPLGGSVVDRKTALDGGGEPYGPLKVVDGAIAQTFRLDGPVPSPANISISNPEAVVVRQGDRSFALALPDLGRSKGCCPVAGLLDADTVVFQSEDRLLAWDVGTHDVQLVAVLTGRTSGEAYAISFADLTEP